MDDSTTETNQNATGSSLDHNSLKAAVAVSLLRSKFFQNQKQTESDALRWKRKVCQKLNRLSDLLFLNQMFVFVGVDNLFSIFRRRSESKSSSDSEMISEKLKVLDRFLFFRFCYSFYLLFDFSAVDASEFDLFPQTASCKCFFFDNLGQSSVKDAQDGSHRGFHDVLRRRFLRQG